MRTAYLISLVTAVAVAAPLNLVEWGEAITRWGSWTDMVAPAQTLLDKVKGSEEDTRNIYDMLRASSEYTRLMKLVDLNKDIVDILKGNNRITFFATNNEALPHRDEDLEALVLRSTGGKHDDDEEDRKRRFKEVIREILLYHIIAADLDTTELANNSTSASELCAMDGSFGGKRRRLKFDWQMLPPALKINNYVRVTSTFHAKNGIVHAIDHPLLPPPDIMDALFLFPRVFSVATTALQKVGLQKEYEFNSRHSKHNEHGKWPIDHHPNDGGKAGYAATTFFAPTNAAFDKLPEDLNAYLFSPFGERALRKLMQFHTIPDYLLYADWIRHVKTDEKDQNNDRRGKKVHAYGGPVHDGEFEFKEMMPTLTDQKMPVLIMKTKSRVPGAGYNYEFKAHGIDVESRDNPAQNGAIHVMSSVLCPRHRDYSDPEQDKKDWMDWKDWFIDWSQN